MDENKKYRKIAIYALSVIVCATVFIVFIARFTDVLTAIGVLLSIMKPFIYGFVLAYLLSPLASFFERKLFPFKKKPRPSLSRTLSLIMAYFIGAAVLTFVFFVLFPAIYRELSLLFRNAVSYSDKIRDSVTGFFEHLKDIVGGERLFSSLKEQLVEELDSALLNIADLSSGAIPAIAGFIADISVEIWSFLVGIIVSVYILASKESFISSSKRFTFAILPQKWATRTIRIARLTHENIGVYFYTQLADSFVVGILFFFFMLIFGIEFPVLFALFLTITNMIPLFGPIVGGGVTFLSLLLIEPLDALWFLILLLFVNFINNRVIHRHMQKRNIGLTSFWMFFAIIFAAGFFGIWGAILGVPFFSVIYYCINRAIEKRLSKKGIPTDEEKSS